MTARSVVNWFRQTYAELGLYGCSSHSGRRTFITRPARLLARTGGSLRDVHLARLTKAERISAWKLCHRLAGQTGYREATIDTILWRACADGYLDSDAYLHEGWEAAVNAVDLVRHRLREAEP